MLFWVFVILVVILDQATKAAAKEVLEHGSLTAIPHVLDLVLVQNTGAAFSIGQGASVLFIIFALVFFVVALHFVANTEDLPFSLVVPIALVAGGGVGNMVDRILTGSVTDFLSLSFMNFPVFNTADVCVTLGAILCFLFYWKWDTQKQALMMDANSQGNA